MYKSSHQKPFFVQVCSYSLVQGLQNHFHSLWWWTAVDSQRSDVQNASAMCYNHLHHEINLHNKLLTMSLLLICRLQCSSFDRQYCANVLGRFEDTSGVQFDGKLALRTSQSSYVTRQVHLCKTFDRQVLLQFYQWQQAAHIFLSRHDRGLRG